MTITTEEIKRLLENEGPDAVAVAVTAEFAEMEKKAQATTAAHLDDLENAKKTVAKDLALRLGTLNPFITAEGEAILEGIKADVEGQGKPGKYLAQLIAERDAIQEKLDTVNKLITEAQVKAAGGKV